LDLGYFKNGNGKNGTGRIGTFGKVGKKVPVKIAPIGK